MMCARTSSRMSGSVDEPVLELLGQWRQHLEDLRRHARERDRVGVSSVDDELHDFAGRVLFHDGLAQIRALGAGEQAMQQPAQHGAHVALEDVSHAFVLPAPAGSAVPAPAGAGRSLPASPLSQGSAACARACDGARCIPPTSSWNSAMALALGLTRCALVWRSAPGEAGIAAARDAPAPASDDRRQDACQAGTAAWNSAIEASLPRDESCLTTLPVRASPRLQPR